MTKLDQTKQKPALAYLHYYTIESNTIISLYIDSSYNDYPSCKPVNS